MDEPDDTTAPQPTQQQPEGMLTPMAAMSCQLHEWYECHLRAGFSEAQALYLVSVQMCGGARPPG
jgi:hypothetical protein